MQPDKCGMATQVVSKDNGYIYFLKKNHRKLMEHDFNVSLFCHDEGIYTITRNILCDEFDNITAT